eukprot:GHUV01001002.1.p1 GENE.GHUV01001002.1~~GHUV01001002.1.p1  ORF type:complete len:587 (+),score=149.39 GHUV01001002.1:244-2004(+)
MGDASVSITVGPQAVKAVVVDNSESMQRTCEQLDGLMDRMQLKAAGEVVNGAGECLAPAGADIVACQPKQSKLMYFKPHDGYAKGCPNPPCFEERHKTAQGVHKHMELHDGEIESTLRLCCKVFDVETATVSLLTGERIYLVGACGALPVCVCPDRWGFCGWSFLNPNHELNVVENMCEDARFSENFFVVSESFKLVFYVMAPLISSNGHRIGTLCIMGQEPRKFDATRGAILANLSELLVRQIERRWVTQEAAKLQGSKLLRSVDCYDTAVGFIDSTDVTSWKVLHLNGPAIDLLGVQWQATYDSLAKLDEGRHMMAFEGMPLRSLLDIDMTAAAWQTAQVELVLTDIKGAVGTGLEGRKFDVSFRLAASTCLDDDAPFSVGVPSWLRETSDPKIGHNYFFMHIKPSAPDSPRQELSKEKGLKLGPLLPKRSPIPNLVLGPLLGRGAYGKVFRGVHHGEEVAVKIIEKLESVRVNKQGIPIEVALTQDFHHLGVLRRYEGVTLNRTITAQWCTRIEVHAWYWLGDGWNKSGVACGDALAVVPILSHACSGTMTVCINVSMGCSLHEGTKTEPCFGCGLLSMVGSR